MDSIVIIIFRPWNIHEDSIETIVTRCRFCLTLQTWESVAFPQNELWSAMKQMTHHGLMNSFISACFMSNSFCFLKTIHTVYHLNFLLLNTDIVTFASGHHFLNIPLVLLTPFSLSRVIHLFTHWLLSSTSVTSWNSLSPWHCVMVPNSGHFITIYVTNLGNSCWFGTIFLGYLCNTHHDDI